MSERKLLTPDEYSTRLEALAESDPDFFYSLAASENLHRLSNLAMRVDKKIAEQKIYRYVYCSAIMFVFLFLKTIGVRIPIDAIFILQGILFSWILYVA